MRCKACNKSLSDAESRAKDSVSGEYLDTCKRCLRATEEALVQPNALSPGYKSQYTNIDQ
jgi:hypothetical protein